MTVFLQRERTRATSAVVAGQGAAMASAGAVVQKPATAADVRDAAKPVQAQVDRVVAACPTARTTEVVTWRVDPVPVPAPTAPVEAVSCATLPPVAPVTEIQVRGTEARLETAEGAVSAVGEVEVWRTRPEPEALLGRRPWRADLSAFVRAEPVAVRRPARWMAGPAVGLVGGRASCTAARSSRRPVESATPSCVRLASEPLARARVPSVSRSCSVGKTQSCAMVRTAILVGMRPLPARLLLSAIAIGAFTAAALYPTIIFFVVALGASVLLATSLMTSRRPLTRALQKFQRRVVEVRLWGAPPPGSPDTLILTDVNSVGAGTHVFFTREGGASMHLKIAIARQPALGQNSVVVRAARYVQWNGRKIPPVVGAPAVSITLKEASFEERPGSGN